jgi:hypothetical protein
LPQASTISNHHAFWQKTISFFIDQASCNLQSDEMPSSIHSTNIGTKTWNRPSSTDCESLAAIRPRTAHFASISESRSSDDDCKRRRTSGSSTGTCATSPSKVNWSGTAIGDHCASPPSSTSAAACRPVPAPASAACEWLRTAQLLVASVAEEVAAGGDGERAAAIMSATLGPDGRLQLGAFNLQQRRPFLSFSR